MSERTKITIRVGAVGPFTPTPAVDVTVECLSSYRESSLKYAAECVAAILDARRSKGEHG